MAIVASPAGTLAATTRTNSAALPAGEIDWYSSGWGDRYDQLTASQSYAELYRRQPWVAITVNKLTGLLVQLPLRVLRKMPDNSRVDARGQAYGRLLMRPSPLMYPIAFWEWVASTYFTHGEAPLFKLRNAVTGRPEGLAPIHPTRLRYGPTRGGYEFDSELLTSDERLTGNRWWFLTDSNEEVMLLRRDLVLWRAYNPHSLQRGMSRLEPLRSTLESEAATQAAEHAIWRQGGRPQFVLTHPKRFRKGTETSQALAYQFQQRHGGVNNWGKPLVLQEGMTAAKLETDSNMSYLGIREANAETMAAGFNLPQPAVGILRRATFNNVTELARMVYRDTMPPILTSVESVLDFELRDGRFDLSVPPDFGPAFYAEWDLAGVLRGTAEQRIEANARAIQTGQKTPAEARAEDNRPFIPGSDQLFVNGAVVPIDQAGQDAGTGTPVGADGGDLPLAPTTNSDDRPWIGQVMGRLSRPQSPQDVDVEFVIEGLPSDIGEAVAWRVAAVAQNGGDMADLRADIRKLEC